MNRIAKEHQREKAVLDKRYWLRISNICNNRCIFCLDSDYRYRKPFVSTNTILKKISQAYRNDYSRLILSGGEPSINPDFVKIVHYAHEIGFQKIQTITNGRMFCYKSFADDVVSAGLDEATFSIHGPNSEIHDKLTGCPGSFRQSVQGIKNLLDTQSCIVNVDIVVNKINLMYVKQIIDFFSRYNIYEFDLLHIVPFGRAFQNKELLFLDQPQGSKHLKKVFELSSKGNYFIWTNRFPPSYFEGIEHLIQDPHKLYDEILGRMELFDSFYKHNKFDCEHPEKCPHCFVKNYCTKFKMVMKYIHNPDEVEQITVNKIDSGLWKYLESVKTGKTLVTNLDQINSIEDSPKRISEAVLLCQTEKELTHELPKSSLQIPFKIKIKKISQNFFNFLREDDSALKSPKQWIIELNDMNNRIILDNLKLIHEYKELFAFYIPSYEVLSTAKLEYQNIQLVLDKISNIPIFNCAPCLNPCGLFVDKKSINLDIIDKKNRPDLRSLTEEYILNNYFVKSTRCEDCKKTESCDGMHINFIRVFSFQILRALK